MGFGRRRHGFLPGLFWGLLLGHWFVGGGFPVFPFLLLGLFAWLALRTRRCALGRAVLTVRLLLLGLVVAGLVYVLSGGHVVFVLLLLLPLGGALFGTRRLGTRRRR